MLRPVVWILGFAFSLAVWAVAIQGFAAVTAALR